MCLYCIQRVALIRTLATKPDILLLDEPFSALDYQTRLAVSDDVYNILKKEHKSAIMVTHDLPSAVKYATHILHLQNGEFYFGNTKDYIHSEVGRKFLGEIKCDHCGGEI